MTVHLNDVFESYSSGQGVAVVDDGLPVIPVPAVQLHAPAAFAEVVDIPGGGRTTTDTTTQQRSDMPVGKRMY